VVPLAGFDEGNSNGFALRYFPGSASNFFWHPSQQK
jgi:hypothetical protein